MVDRLPRRQGFPSGSVTALGLVGAAAVGLALLWWLTGRPTTSQVAVSRPPAVAPAQSVPTTSASPAPGDSTSPLAGLTGPSQEVSGSDAPAVTVTVDVRGRVGAPGIRELPAGSRVMDAVRAAGGLLPGHHYGAVNLARVLVDGEQIRVGADWGTGAAPAPSGGPTVPPPVAGQAAVNLNTATAVELEEVDGVGPVLAAAIVQWRTDNGPFQSVEDLLDVSGIGEATLAGMRDQVTVG